MNTTTRRAVRQALEAVAGRLPAVARDTVLRENCFKHTWEVVAIDTAARDDDADDDASVCDLGGGLGVNLLVLRELGWSGRLVLIDRLDEYDEQNRMGRADDILPLLEQSRIEVVRQDFWNETALPLDDGAFDVTTCFDVLEHLPGHPLRQLRELRRILVPGGTCIIGAPNGVSLMKRLRVVAGEYPYAPFEEWLKDPYIEHYREYTRAEYEELLRRAGFTDVRSHASAAVTLGRARNRYHRRQHPVVSPTVIALWGLALFESAFPSLRHTAYATGVRADQAPGADQGPDRRG